MGGKTSTKVAQAKPKTCFKPATPSTSLTPARARPQVMATAGRDYTAAGSPSLSQELSTSPLDSQEEKLPMAPGISAAVPHGRIPVSPQGFTPASSVRSSRLQAAHRPCMLRIPGLYLFAQLLAQARALWKGSLQPIQMAECKKPGLWQPSGPLQPHTLCPQIQPLCTCCPTAPAPLPAAFPVLVNSGQEQLLWGSSLLAPSLSCPVRVQSWGLCVSLRLLRL